MNTGRILSALALAAAMVGFAGIASAQNAGNRVAESSDWQVFEGTEPKACWAVTAPKKTLNTRGGQEVTVNRGDILLFVTYQPGQKRFGEVSFTGGYPFEKASTATLEIDGAKFDLFTLEEHAWAASEEEDRKIVTALKRGAEAVVTARSSRGTDTKDTFSLIGATAMIEDAEKRCGS